MLIADGTKPAAEYLGEEVAIATRGFKKAGIDTQALIRNARQVEHVIDKLGRREDLAVIDNTLSGNSLSVHTTINYTLKKTN